MPLVFSIQPSIISGPLTVSSTHIKTSTTSWGFFTVHALQSKALTGAPSALTVAHENLRPF